MHTKGNPQHIFSSWRIAFSVSYLLGIFPVQLDKTKEVFQFKQKSAILSGIFWTTAFSAAVYTQLHFILDIDVIGGANTVGCQTNVTRGPDVIYNILSSLYFVFDFFILASGLLFAKHMAPALSKFLILVEEFVHLNPSGAQVFVCFDIKTWGTLISSKRWLLRERGFFEEPKRVTELFAL